MAWIPGSRKPTGVSASGIDFPVSCASRFLCLGSWCHLGLLFAGLATLAAIPGDYFDTHTKIDLFYAGFSTYAQLTGAAIGVALAKMIREKSGRS